MFLSQTQAWNELMGSKVQSSFLIRIMTMKNSFEPNMMTTQLYSCKIGEKNIFAKSCNAFQMAHTITLTRRVIFLILHTSGIISMDRRDVPV